MIHEPGNFDGGERIKGPVSHLDLPPTLAGLLGFRVAGGRYPGVDFIGGEVDAGRVLRFSCRPDLLSLTRLEANEKYIHHFGKKPEEYYDLTKDPGEKINLAGKVGEARLSVLRREMISWHAWATAAYSPDAAAENA
ncbi:hypothetical protein [Rubrobacter indicoceani]|uniref:hypothetical protein n=1 Tax=Rubrobacter indicoceani TaxID=2051957 RepID=UPI000E5A3D8F|nr:hypothetical protein [Rubrobacter indicoceani]